MSIDLASLGLSQDVIQNKIIDAAVSRIVERALDGSTIDIESRIAEQAKVEIDKAVDRIGNEFIAPKVAEIIDGLVFQRTTVWGEPAAPAQTWRELLESKAENYLTEPVNYEGKTKAEGGYSWSKSTTRVAFLIDRHLQYHIKTAMEAALKDVNSAITGGIAGAVKTALGEVMTRLKVQVVTK